MTIYDGFYCGLASIGSVEETDAATTLTHTDYHVELLRAYLARNTAALGFATDVGFVYLDNAAHLGRMLFGHRFTDTVHHVPRGTVAADIQVRL